MKPLPTRRLTIRGGTERVTARPATEADWPGIVSMHCTVPDMPWPRPPEQMTPEERTRYGGGWMSVETLCPLYALYVERNSPILVAEDEAGRIVGNVDLWLADEPEPIGRNAFVEIVQEHAEYLGSGLENAMLTYAAETARTLGYPALDGSFGIGGLGTDYFDKRRIGFRIWDEHDRVEVACAAGPLPQVTEAPAAGSAVSGLVVLGRYAPTEYIWLRRTDRQSYRFEVRTGKGRCLIQGLDAAFVRGAAEPGKVLDVTLYVPPDRRHDAALVGELLHISAALGGARGFSALQTWIPSAVTERLTGVGLRWARYAGTCLRMRL